MRNFVGARCSIMPCRFVVAVVLMAMGAVGGAEFYASPILRLETDVTYSDYGQSNAIASDAEGNCVVAYQGFDPVAGGYGIFFQRFDSTGALIGTEQSVVLTDDSTFTGPQLVMNATGQFVIAWGQFRLSDHYARILVKTYNSNGSISNDTIVVTDTDVSHQYAVGISANGDFAVAWNGNWLKIARYDATGSSLGIAAPDTNYLPLERLSMSMNSSGDAVIVGYDSIQDVFARKYYASTNSFSQRVSVSYPFNYFASNVTPIVAMNEAGGYVAAWQQEESDGSTGLVAQCFNSDTSPKAAPFIVRENFYGNWIAIAAAPQGEFVVCWSSAGTFAQPYNSDGTPNGGLIVVAPASGKPSVAMDTLGDFVVSWNPYGDAFYQRRFSLEPIAMPSPSALSLVPSVVAPGSGGFALAVFGSNFVKGSVVHVDGNSRPTLMVSPNQLIASVPSVDVSSPRVLYITVVNPLPGGGTSLPLVLTVGSGIVEPTMDDIDGDGFSNALEIAAGTSVDNASSTPLNNHGAVEFLPLVDVKLRIQLNFRKPAADSILLSGTVLLTDGFSIAGQGFLFSVGNVARKFVLDANGRAKNGGEYAAVSSTGLAPRSAKFVIKLKRGNYESELAGFGLDRFHGKKELKLPLTLIFGGNFYKQLRSVAYVGRHGISGLAK